MKGEKYTRIYIVNNEFHLFTVLTQYYHTHQSKGETILVMLTKHAYARRIDEGRYNLPFAFYYLEDHFVKIGAGARFDYEAWVREHFTQCPELVIFHDTVNINVCLVKIFRKLFNCKVFLFMDGTAGYHKKPFNLKAYLKAFYKYAYFRFIKAYKLSFTFKWGRSKLYDILYTLYPEKVNIKTKNPVQQLSLRIESDQVLSEIQRAYNFHITDYIPNREKVFLYLTLGALKYLNKYKGTEIDIMCQLRELAVANGYKFVIKAKAIENIELYKKHLDADTVFITEPVNAELISYYLRNSIICSWYSATNLYNVETNKFYWLYPILQELNYEKFLPSHVKLIDNIADIFTVLPNTP